MTRKGFRRCAKGRLCTVLISGMLMFTVCERISEAATQSKLRITTASGVRLRTGPQVTAEEVGRLPIGVVVEEMEASTSAEKIAGVEDRWYRVALPDGKQGWLFGGFTMRFDATKAAEAYLEIASNRLKAEQLAFTEAVDLSNFLSRVMPEAKGAETAAELEFARLLAIQRAAEAIPIDKQEEPLYQSWIKAQGDRLVYSEPAGQWFIKSDLLWELQKKYGALPVAERIAWAAAKNPLPGECEGYLPCSLYSFNQTTVRYLRLYPRGAHAEEVIDNLVEFIDEVAKDKERYEADDRADLRKGLGELRAAVMKTTSPKKAALLKKIDLLAARYGK